MANNREGLPLKDLPVEKQVQTLQILVAALALGAMAFGAVVNLFIGPAGGGERASGVMTTVGLGLGLIALLSHRTVAALVLAPGLRELPKVEDAAKRQLMAAKVPSTIAACAILEGATFFNLICYGFLEGQAISMAMAAILWLAILTRFPLPGSLEGWMDRELRAAKEERELKGNA